MPRILVVGMAQRGHVGSFFLEAARSTGKEARLEDAKDAFEAATWRRRVNWWLRGHRPADLAGFSQRVLNVAEEFGADIVIATGLAPLDVACISALRQKQTITVNYSTDDPWNPRQRGRWFLDTLPHYTAIFTPRRSNVSDFSSHGCKNVYYLPFAYEPSLHFVERPTVEEEKNFAADVVFAGGADRERLPLLKALIETGLRVDLYGAYWGREPATRARWKGHAEPQTLRKAIAAAKVCPCLVRRANRDGHAMRSYEVPAIGGVILAEATDDHKEMFGEEGALYFRDIPEMITKAKWLIAHQADARQMAECARVRVTAGPNTYRDRLETILAMCLS